jgi:hypothetical protein
MVFRGELLGTDDVELHYAATNTNWTEELVKQVRYDVTCYVTS